MPPEGYRSVTLKPAYVQRIDEFRDDQPVDPGDAEVLYAALDMFFEEHGIEPPDR